MRTGRLDIAMDAELTLPLPAKDTGGHGSDESEQKNTACPGEEAPTAALSSEASAATTTSVNLTTVPLRNLKCELIGCMLVMDDINNEKRLKGTLARYMTKAVADQLMANAESFLGGQLTMATVLFSDIRNFTAMAERIGPQDTVSMLNDYFTEMVDIIFNHGGILDKYIGDAMLAVFGAPFSTGRDADQATRAAVNMLVSLREFNSRRVETRIPAIHIGVGINSDEVLVGNVGSPKRMDYTVIGDGVNLAARLESATKYYGSSILISEFTLQSLTDTYILREVDLIVVKGKTKPVAIYEVLDFHDSSTFPHLEEAIGHFHEGLLLYRAGSWHQAMCHFERALAIHPEDRLPAIYLERCRQLLAEPPRTCWDGVFVMREK